MHPLILLLAAFVLWFVLPVFAVAFWIRADDRGPLTAPERALVAALPIGLGTIMVIHAGMGRLGAISSANGWVLGAVVALASAVSAGVAFRQRRHRVSDDRWWTALGALTIAGTWVAFPTLLTVIARPDSFIAPTPWYYWNLVGQTVAAKGFPTTSIEWATTVPFLGDYPGFTAATALLATMSDRPDLLHAGQLIRVVAPAFLGVGVYLFARSWRSVHWLALAAAVGVASTEVMAVKSLSYRPEALGYGLMLLVPTAAHEYLRSRDPWMLGAASVGLAGLSQIHGIDWTFALIMLISVAGARFVADLVDRPTLGPIALAVIVPLIMSVSVNLMVNGRGSDIGKLRTAPSIDATGIDPTWEFASSGSTDAPPPRPSEIARSSLTKGFLGGPDWLLGALVVLAIGAWVAADRDRSLAQLSSFLALTLLGAGLLSIVFVVGWDTYVPQRTGTGRLLQLIVLLLPITVAVLGSSARTRTSSWIVAGGLVVITATAWLGAQPVIAKISRAQQPPAGLLAIERNVRLPRGIALANAYTEGFLPAVFHLDGVIDGRAPYTDAELLDRANILLRRARAYFEDPDGAPFPFTEVGVQYVVVADKWALGTPRIFPADIGALRAAPDLEAVVDEPGLVIFRVIPDG